MAETGSFKYVSSYCSTFYFSEIANPAYLDKSGFRNKHLALALLFVDNKNKIHDPQTSADESGAHLLGEVKRRVIAN